MSWYVIISFCHACYISEYIYLHVLRINFLLKSQPSRGQGISCLAHHLERTDNKPLSRLIGPIHINKWGNCLLKLVSEMPLTFCNLAKSFKHNMWQQHVATHNHLVSKPTLNRFAKQPK